jgi:hypothetical protein
MLADARRAVPASASISVWACRTAVRSRPFALGLSKGQPEREAG